MKNCRNCPHEWVRDKYVYGLYGDVYQDYLCRRCGMHKVRQVYLRGVGCDRLQEVE